MLQQARNLLMHVGDHDRLVQFLIHDRDAKFPRAFDALFDRDEIKVIRTPVRAANANAHMVRWVGTVRRECLDRLLILGRRQLEHVLRVYVEHYNHGRPHRALDLKPPDPRIRSPIATATTTHTLQLSRRDPLGGLIHGCEPVADQRANIAADPPGDPRGHVGFDRASKIVSVASREARLDRRSHGKETRPCLHNRPKHPFLIS